MLPPGPEFAKYCGPTADEAEQNCWQPCRNAGDCCFEQGCFEAAVTCSVSDYIGSDHFFCGSDYCDASFNCRAPCPSGFDAECGEGYRCFANTPCNARILEETSSNLFYGLPRNSLELLRYYRPEEAQGPNKSGASLTTSMGLIWSLCMACLFSATIV